MPQHHDDKTDSGPGPSPPDAEVRRQRDAPSRARIGPGLRLHDADVRALPIPKRLRTPIDDLAARSDPEVPR